MEVKIRENMNNAKETLKNFFNECRFDNEGWKNLSDQLTNFIFEYNPTSLHDPPEDTSRLLVDMS